MSTTVSPLTPQGNVPAINVPASQDYARLVFAAPYFDTIPIAEILEPSVLEACESLLPGLVPPFVTDAAQQAVQDLAVLLAGSTMSGPLFLNGLPTQPTQAADKQYVDMMVATSGVPEVPTVPTGQVWGRTTGQWVPIASAEGTFLPLSGGTMGGIINMGGNAINNLPAVPNLPNGAAPAQWVLNSIAASSLYQGTWDVDTYQPDLTQPQYHQNNFSWIAITTTAGVVVSPPIPGLQGMTIYNGDTIIYSAQAGGVFQAIHAGGLSLSEADARYLQLAGGQMGGALLLYEDPVQNMEAATRQWVLAQVSAGGIPEAPTDGQIYGRNGNIRDWMPVVGLGGATLTGPLFLAANAAQAMQAVPLQQLNSSLGSYVPLIGNVTVTGPITMTGVSSNLTLNSNATTNLQAVPLQQLTSTLGSYLTATAAANTYLPLVGGTLTGSLTVNGTLAGTDWSISPTGVANLHFVSFPGATEALSFGGIDSLGFFTATGSTSGFHRLVLSYEASGYTPAIALGASAAAYGVMVLSGGAISGWSMTPSDRRLKSNIRPTEQDAIEVVNSIPIHALDFTSRGAGTSEPWPFSMIADEVAGIAPFAAVSMEEDDGAHWIALHPQHLISVLWRAVQQLSAKIVTLEAKVA